MVHSLKMDTAMLQRQVGPSHRRRIKTEEKAKIVAAVWGGRIFTVLAFAVKSINKLTKLTQF